MNETVGHGGYSFVKSYDIGKVVKEILDYPEMTGIGSWRDYMIYILPNQLTYGHLRLIPYIDIMLNDFRFSVVGMPSGRKNVYQSFKIDPLKYVMPRAQMNSCQLIKKMAKEQWSSSKKSGIIEKIFLECLLDLKFLYDYGFLHLDVKPENILLSLDENDNLLWARLCDFSFIEPNNDEYRHTGECCFTFGLRPPEHMMHHRVSPTSDIWSLGSTIFEILTGRVFMPSNGILKCAGETFHISHEADAIDYFKKCIITGKWKDELIDSMIALGYSNDEIKKWYTILEKMIVYEPEKRATLDELLSDDFFSDVRAIIKEQTEHKFISYNLIEHKKELEISDPDYKSKFAALHKQLNPLIKKDIIIRGLDLFLKYCKNSCIKPVITDTTKDIYRICIFIMYKFLMPCGVNKSFSYVFTFMGDSSKYTDEYVYNIESDIVGKLPSIWYKINDTDKLYREIF